MPHKYLSDLILSQRKGNKNTVLKVRMGNQSEIEWTSELQITEGNWRGGLSNAYLLIIWTEAVSTSLKPRTSQLCRSPKALLIFLSEELSHEGNRMSTFRTERYAQLGCTKTSNGIFGSSNLFLMTSAKSMKKIFVSRSCSVNKWIKRV